MKATKYCTALFVTVLSLQQALAANPPVASAELPATVVPRPSSEDRAAAAGWRGGGNWLDQHHDINRIGESYAVDLAFLGDSITQGWGGPGRRVGAPAAAVLDRFFGHLNVANFGISGDRTQHILWRIDHGNFDAIDPKYVVLLIGTNNLTHDSADDIATGIEAILDRLANNAPRTTALLCSVVRGADPNDPLRKKADRLNELIRPLARRANVRFVDLAELFLLPDGRANPELIRGDFVHFKEAGYRTWAEALRPHLKELLDIEPRVPVVPVPARMLLGEGEFTLTHETRILCNQSSDEAAATRLGDAIHRATGHRLTCRARKDNDPPQGAILLSTRTGSSDLGAEGYSLDVTTTFIVLRGAQPAGLFYATQTLLQLLPPEVYSKSTATGRPLAWNIPCISIVDKPRFAWRGLMLDASRHFQSVEYVKRYLDLMALHKLNVFHWHLVDGHGWRVEIKKYPNLTEVGAWRNQPGYPKAGETGRYGGFYSQDEIREVVDYARARHITIVPEIEMPGHSWAAIAAYPHLSCTKQPQEVAYFFDYPCKEQKFPAMEGSDVFCAGSDATYTFLEDVLTEVLALFPSEFIHIGGDEVDKKWWKACETCQARMRSEGLANEHELQSHFIKRIERFLAARGRRLIGWDEILEGGLAPNATVMSWRGTQGGIAAARQGHDVVMSPNKALYFDHFQSTAPSHPSAWPGLNSLRTVYDYEPVPAELSGEQATHVLGAQANVWTCFTHTDALLDMMTYPRACALAEITWSPRESRDWSDFSRRMKTHKRRLDAIGVNYYRGTPVIP